MAVLLLSWLSSCLLIPRRVILNSFAAIQLCMNIGSGLSRRTFLSDASAISLAESVASRRGVGFALLSNRVSRASLQELAAQHAERERVV
jgi:hypothetical protein